MPYLATRRVNRGTTLVEVAITAIIAGILAAFAAPSMMGLLQSNQVTQGLNQVQNALKEAKQQAIRRGKSCTITLDTAATPYPKIAAKAGSEGCLASSAGEIDGVAIATNFTNNEIAFSFKGNTTTMGTIVIKPKNGKGEQKCLAMGLGTGIMRTGTYTGAYSESQPNAEKCVSST